MSRARRSWLCLLAVLAVAVTVARGGAELVLQDGRIVGGTDLRRQGENYLLTQPDGEVVTIPVQLVRELRLIEQGDAGPRPAPTAMRNEGPEVLAGPEEPVAPPATDAQLAVLGPAAEFRPSIFDPVWVPTSDWTLDPAQNDFNPARWFTSPIDPWWAPISAFDGRVDVFARTHAVWVSSPIDPVWWPTGTTWLTPRVPEPSPEEPEANAPAAAEEAEPPPAELAQFTPAGRPPSRSGRVDPEVCAREIFRPLTSRSDRGRAAPVVVEPVVDASLSNLPLELFRGKLTLDGQAFAAIFSTEGETCRLLGGDLDPLLGITLGDTGRIEHSLRSYERAVDSRAVPALETAEDKVGFAFSLVTLADPATGSGERAPILLDKREALERLGAEGAPGCTIGVKKRSREIEIALADFDPPTVLDADLGEIVTFRSWSPDGGTVSAYTVRLAKAGTKTIEHRVVASHVGDHDDEKSRK